MYGCELTSFLFLHTQEARNIEDFIVNFKNDPTVKIPLVYKKLSGSRVLVMEWIDGIRCTDPQVCRIHHIIFLPISNVNNSFKSCSVIEFASFFSQAIKEAGLDVEGFLTVGVSAALRQLLEFGLFHGDPHPGNVFAMRDGRIAYVDFGNVAVLSQVWNCFCLAAPEFIFPVSVDWILIVACLPIYD